MMNRITVPNGSQMAGLANLYPIKEKNLWKVYKITLSRDVVSIRTQPRKAELKQICLGNILPHVLIIYIIHILSRS